MSGSKNRNDKRDTFLTFIGLLAPIIKHVREDSDKLNAFFIDAGAKYDNKE